MKVQRVPDIVRPGAKAKEFVEAERITPGDTFYSATLLYKIYKKWCESEGKDPSTMRIFTRGLRQEGFKSKKIQNKLFFGMSEGVENGYEEITR